MLLDLYKGIGDQLLQNKPFVVYRKPKETWIKVILQKNKELHFVDDYTESGFVFAPFDSLSRTILLKSDEIYETDNVPIKADRKDAVEFYESLDTQKEFHINLVKKGISEINMGVMEKVVLSRRMEIGCKKKPLELFKCLLETYSNAFCYLWYHPKVGMWLGATPEILLRTQNNRLETMSLAGTQMANGPTPPIWGKKELDEQRLVTHFIGDALRNKLDQLKISATESVRAGNLWHLRTSISGIMDSLGLKEIIEALHPTPAVCGIPRKVTKEFIFRNEGYDREYYTGFLGELNFREHRYRSGQHNRNPENRVYQTIKNKTQLYVNLRCMQLREDRAMIYVGGGVTQDSVPEKEWEETVDKSGTMLKVIAN